MHPHKRYKIISYKVQSYILEPSHKPKACVSPEPQHEAQNHQLTKEAQEVSPMFANSPMLLHAQDTSHTDWTRTDAFENSAG